MGRVAAVTNKNVQPGNDITVSYEYDELGNLTKVIDGNANETTYHYQSSTNLLTKTTDDIGKNLFYYYDSYRRLTKTGAGSSSGSPVDPVTYAFNSTEGYLDSVTYVNNVAGVGNITKTATYDYDNYGRMTNLVDWLNPGVSTGHFFDFDASTGRMLEYTDFDGETLEYTYYVDGRVSTMTDYDGNVTSYTYTDTGELSTLTAPGSKVWDFDYNAIHQRTQVTYPNGMKALYEYDTANRLTKIEYNDGGSPATVLDGWFYELNPDGNISGVYSLVSSQAWYYFYDGRNRLESAIRANADGIPQFRERYVYDDGDNMLTKQTYVYDVPSSIMDSFDDGDYTNDPTWTVGAGTWAVDAGGGYLYNTGTSADQLYLANGVEDLEMVGLYILQDVTASTDYLDFIVRYSFDHSPTDQVSVRIYEDKMTLRERYNGVTTSHDLTDVDSPEGQAFALYVRCIGSTLEVWRDGGSGWQMVGSMGGLQTVNTSRLYINTAGDIDAIVNDLSYMAHKSGTDSFVDTFADNNYHLAPAWTTGSGTWGAASGYLEQTLTSGTPYATIANASPDNQLKLSVKKTAGSNSLRLYSREVDSTHKVYVEITDTALNLKQQDTSTTTLDTASITTTTNTWYDYHIITDGAHMEVWRGPQGGTTELVLETDALTVLESDSIILATHSCTAQFDNIEFIAADPRTTTFTYNGANELTTMTEGGTTTTFTYDAWGRTISKDDGTYDADYIWLFGDKLKQYNTTFPGEQSVAFNYDGLGKRRVKLSPTTGYTDADWTWYRWDAGWNMIGEYAAGTDTGTEWDVGGVNLTLTRAITSKWGGEVVCVSSSFLSVSVSLYPVTDHIGTIREMRDNALGVWSRRDYLPFGAPLLDVGGSAGSLFANIASTNDISLYYTPYRYYDNSIVRWLSRDPLAMLSGPNGYIYPYNPISFTDRLRLIPTKEEIERILELLELDIPDLTEFEDCIPDGKKCESQGSSFCEGACLCLMEKEIIEREQYMTCVEGCENPPPPPSEKGGAACGAGTKHDNDTTSDVILMLVVCLCLVIRSRPKQTTNK